MNQRRGPTAPPASASTGSPSATRPANRTPATLSALGSDANAPRTKSGKRRVKTAPTFELAASQLPPCARTIASTIASPRPAPPWARERAESARENRSKSRSSPVRRQPGAFVGDLDREPPAERAGASA